MRLFVEERISIYRSISNLKKDKELFSTINWMGRLSKELKNYTRIKDAFQCEKSADKILYLFFSQKNGKYLSRRIGYSDILMEAFIK